ncbi:MAG TPA: nucleotidyl transferase AbiEii/AbiGii toxin family protein [Thermoanaerobaculia bacterium]|jgi:hypothetical protein|nr:nucleotidyl transferase AbiEii/AbiGii toxin family protein [Thermoanaerobaculia bacterium]
MSSLTAMFFGRIIVDSSGEILANKLCALLSRTEVRDLVDVARLEEAGHDLLEALHLASQKDGGMSAAQLAWVLSSFPIPSAEAQYHGMSPKEIDDFRESLVRRLTTAAFPRSFS